jgi:tRNA modification GTPase
VEHQSSHRGREPREAVNDTIVAAATPPGRGGIAIVRVSGPATPHIARAMLDALPVPRVATRTHFRNADHTPIDHGLACYFPAPQSYTGESVLELHSHGSPVVVEALIRRMLELGARRAGPGEFTQRAYLNSKLDLAQAEAVADLINAASEHAARAALRSLEGEFSRRVVGLSDALGQMRVYVEAAIDFAEEEIDVLSSQALRSRLQASIDALHALEAAGRQGRLLTQGMTLVIAGRPNAGKSTLLNRLAGHDAAIVTETPGTTRDVLREHIVIDGLPLQLLDTAGLRQASDAIEAEGIRRARAAIASADRILFVIDAASDPQAAAFREELADLPSHVPVTIVFNKVDLAEGRAPIESLLEQLPVPVPAVVSVSALTGEGIEALVAHLRSSGGLEPGVDALSARARHLEALKLVGAALDEAAGQLARHGTPELVAEELKRAQLALGEIVGAQSSDELLGQIFASFCIGK